MNTRYVKEKLVLKPKIKVALSKLLVTIIIFLIGLICIKKGRETDLFYYIRFTFAIRLYSDGVYPQFFLNVRAK